MIKEKILENLQLVLEKLNIKDVDVALKQPANPAFGDYSSSIALKLTKQLSKNPLSIAEQIKNNFPKTDFIEKIDVVKPGFINFWIADEQLINQMINFANDLFNIPQFYSKKKIMIEYTDPNILKEFHIGHLYSNIVGESLACIFEISGAEVCRANYQGDVGMHVAKAIWGIIKNMKKESLRLEDIEKFDLAEKAKFMGQSYALGTQEYEENEQSKKEIIDLNKKIYSSDLSIKNLYDKVRQWSLDYFEIIYQRLGTNFNEYFFESEAGKVGLNYVKENLKKGIFKESNGAIVFDGGKYGLHTRVFINSLGLPTYEAKDLGLAPTKYKRFSYDLSIIVVGNEVKEYFKVVRKALEQINPDLGKKTTNIFTGMVNLPDGKMSSRLGNVITVESLLNDLHKKAWEKIQETTKTKFEGEYALYSKEAKVKPSKQWSTAETVAIAALKYALLKNGLGQNIEFNINESVSFDGNSGPYLLYTFVRCQSVLNKSGLCHPLEKRDPGALDSRLRGNDNQTTIKQFNNLTINKDESNVLRLINQFPEIVQQAAIQLSPNLIANYLYDLAQKYNYFYQKNKILESEEKTKQFRLMLTAATGKVIKEGLYLLGIKTVERM